MRLVTFSYGEQTRIGALVGDQIVDIAQALRAYAKWTGRKRPRRLPQDLKGLLEEDGQLLKLIARCLDLVRDRIQELEAQGDVVCPLDRVRLKAPIANPGKIIGVGLNYSDHARESGAPIPKEPVLFAKFPTAVIGPDEPIVIPHITEKVDFEAELAIVIGKRCKRVSEEQAYDYVAGYMVFNDVSARDLQFGDGQWVRGKSLDTFAPSGPHLVTKDEVPDPHSLDIELTLNGSLMQKSNTQNLIFKVPQLVSFISQGITLEPGDIIASGTPPGVGAFRQPPVYLKPGDIVEVRIEGVGTLRNPVVAAS